MLDGLKRLFARRAPMPADWDPVLVWAERQRYVFRVQPEGEGFVVDGHLGVQPWRLEWGPAQRSYIGGSELRLRAEPGTAPGVQAMVLDRELQASMEQAVFEQYVESVQTRIDQSTPPEMRWLVMLNKASGAELGALREGFAAVSTSRPWLACWVEGALAPALLGAPRAPGQPVVLTLARGRLTLRAALPEPTPQALEAWVRIFGTALREARRAAEQVAPEPPSTQASGWESGPGAGHADPAATSPSAPEDGLDADRLPPSGPR